MIFVVSVFTQNRKSGHIGKKAIFIFRFLRNYSWKNYAEMTSRYINPVESLEIDC